MKRLLFILFFVAPSLWATEVTPTPAVSVAIPPATIPVATSTQVPNPSPNTGVPNTAPAINVSAIENDILQKAQELEQALPIIRQQVADTIQSVNQQEQRINDQIAQLQMQNAQLYDQINRLSRQLNEAHQQIAQENKQEAQSTIPKTSLMKWAGIVFMVSFLLMAFTLLWPHLKRKEKTVKREVVPEEREETIVEEEDDDQEFEKEYDFMNSREAVPVKLDLARAYIDMGEQDSAREVLQAVLEQGNEEQRAEAERLLSSVNQS